MYKKRFVDHSASLCKNLFSCVSICLVLFSASAAAQVRGTPLPRDSWYGTYQNSNTVIVFVHGIFGDSNTFLYEDKQDPSKDVFWPALAAADRSMGQASIFMGGFYTSPKSLDFGADYAAEEFFSALGRPDDALQRAVLDHQNIIFVAHSTGGIIVRRLLVKHPDAFKGKHVGLVLIASPSTGSSWADRLSPIAKLANNQLAGELRENNPFLTQLDKDFKDLLGSGKLDIKGVEAAENVFIIDYWYLPTKVVDVQAAARYFPNPVMLPGTNHFTSVKPDSTRHPAYTLLADFFSRYFAAQTVPYPLAPPNSAKVRIESGKPAWTSINVADAPVPIRNSTAIAPSQCLSGTTDSASSEECTLQLRVPSHNPFQMGDYRLSGVRTRCTGNPTICSSTTRHQVDTVIEGSIVSTTVTLEFSNRAAGADTSTPVVWELFADIQQFRVDQPTVVEQTLPYGTVVEVPRPQTGELVSLQGRLLNATFRLNAGDDAKDRGIYLLDPLLQGELGSFRYQIGRR